MRTVAEHQALILAQVAPLPPVTMPLVTAAGLVAAGPLTSRVDLPGFDNSAMDGYAVRAADVRGASPGRPTHLRVVGHCAAGDSAVGMAVGEGEAIRIMTGAPMPAGADTVVKVELTDGGDTVVAIVDEVPIDTSIRRRGEDLRRGGAVLAAGQVLTPRRLALLAAAGHGQVSAHPRPRVAVVSTGAELVAPGDPLADGQIYDSNSTLLATLVEASGGRTAYRGSIGDDPATVRDLLDRLAGEADLVVTSGGVSMGVHDVVKDVLRDSGSVEFVQVAMQPGKPQGFGRLGSAGVPFFGLPGNPVSAAVSFEMFVRPAIRRMLALDPAPATVRVTIEAGMRSPAGKLQIARAVLSRDGDRLRAHPVSGQGSHFVADLADATAYLLVPAEVTALSPGDEVEAIVLDPPEGGSR
ncbi:MAG TPA: molybdopterin molybdotransferase MoeA [Dermatophilaceae bacterium]|nr:molybdopterin molybdotransferase MoeA [Dermatophilaceae bacterium]